MELTQADKTKLLGLLERYVTAFEKTVEATTKIADATVKTMAAATDEMKRLDK